MALKHHYVEENTEGLFRVRDKDHGDGSPVIIWGSDLEHEQAHALKERVVGRGLSTTARIESMDKPLPATAVTPRGEPLTNTPPANLPRPSGSLVKPGSKLHGNPRIADVQAKAMAAARAPAVAAQERSDNLIALPQHAHHPNDALPFAPEVPEGPEIEFPDSGELDAIDAPEADPTSLL